jgi:hypothetical protein
VSKDLVTVSTYNNPELTKRLVDVWKKSLGDENVEIVDPTMGGDDFWNTACQIIPLQRFIFTLEPSIRRRSAEYKQTGKGSAGLHSSNSRLSPNQQFDGPLSELTTAVRI